MFLHSLPSLKTVLDSYRVENEAMISNKTFWFNGSCTICIWSISKRRHRH